MRPVVPSRRRYDLEHVRFEETLNDSTIFLVVPRDFRGTLFARRLLAAFYFSFRSRPRDRNFPRRSASTPTLHSFPELSLLLSPLIITISREIQRLARREARNCSNFATRQTLINCSRRISEPSSNGYFYASPCAQLHFTEKKRVPRVKGDEILPRRSHSFP